MPPMVMSWSPCADSVLGDVHHSSRTSGSRSIPASGPARDELNSNARGPRRQSIALTAIESGRALFRERLVILDSKGIDTALVIPV